MSLFSVSSDIGRFLVVLAAAAVLVGFLVWAHRRRSRSFFLGVLAGSGIFLAFDIIWIHWIFGLHHLTNAPEDLVLEPLLVVTGVALLWTGLRRSRRDEP